MSKKKKDEGEKKSDKELKLNRKKREEREGKSDKEKKSNRKEKEEREEGKEKEKGRESAAAAKAAKVSLAELIRKKVEVK